MKIKNKKSLVAIIAVFVVVLIGVTIAYLQSTDTFENVFNAGKYKTETTEAFESPTNWAPGDVTPKTIVTTNRGTMPVRVRVKFREEWKNESGTQLDLSYNGNLVSLIDLDNQNDWVYSDGYYYFKNALAPNQATTSVLKSVTFNPLYQPTVTCSESLDGMTHTCDSSDAGYLGGTYKLFITTETVQADNFKEAWGLDYDPAAAPISMFGDEVELSDLSISYTCTGNNSLDARIDYTKGTETVIIIVPIDSDGTSLSAYDFEYGSSDLSKIAFREQAITDSVAKSNFEAYVRDFLVEDAADTMNNTCINF